MIKSFQAFWVDFANTQELELVTSKAKETILEYNGKCYPDLMIPIIDPP